MLVIYVNNVKWTKSIFHLKNACDEIAQMVEWWRMKLEAPGSNPATNEFVHAMLQRVTSHRVYRQCIHMCVYYRLKKQTIKMQASKH